MNAFIKIFSLLLEFMQREFDLFGFTVSFWQIFIFSCLSSIIGTFIGSIFKS